MAPPPQPTPAPAYELAPAPVAPVAGDMCPACAAPWREGLVFCTTCGARRDRSPEPAVEVRAPVSTPNSTVIVRRCPDGHVVDDVSVFCPQCGVALAG